MDTNREEQSLSPPVRVPDGGGGWKKYALAAVVAMVVMAAGAVVGAGVTILYFGRMVMPRHDTAGQAARFITGRLSDSANLSPEERARTEALVEKHMAEVAEIRERYEEEITGKLGIITDGVGEIIGPERARMCGDWMHRYRGRRPAIQNPGKPGRKDCDCAGESRCGAKQESPGSGPISGRARN